MYLQSIASAFPENCLTQAEVWELIQSGPAINLVGRRGARILERILMGNSGVETRHFALHPSSLFALDAQALNESFEKEAPDLARAALVKAAREADWEPGEIDALYVCTCTGYLCPGVSSHLAERFGMRPDATLHDITGLGCGAAIPTLHAASCHLAAHPEAVVATVAVEVCSAAFFLCDDSGVAVSACLFGDGAAAAIWRAGPSGTGWHMSNFQSLHVPAEREKIRFVNDAGRLRNKLHRAVPGVAADAVSQLFAKRNREPDALIAHPGGRDVIDAVHKRIPGHPLHETRECLRKYGNLSSPSVLVALENRLSAKHPGDQCLWLTGFGAGFSAYACQMECGNGHA
jgi:predicted naringenin-chalcone synthase